MITLRKGGLNMFGKFNITNEEYISVLTEINSISPETWFVAVNKGKDKKVNRGFLINNTENTIQLIPIKKINKAYIIDKENLIILSKTEDIKKIIYVIDDLYSFLRIHLNNGFTFKLRVYNVFSNKLRKKNFKEFRKPYKKQSVKAQVSLLIYYIIGCTLIFAEILFGVLFGVLNIPNNSNLYKHYQYAKSLQMFIEDEEHKQDLSVVLKPYEKLSLELDGDYTTVKAADFKFNLPEGYIKHIAPDYNEEESTLIIYDYKNDGDKKRILIDKEPYVGIDYTELDEKIGKACEKEFGFRIDSHYNWSKLMWVMDYYNGDINYFDPEELLLYGSMASTKAAFVGAVTEVYEVETPTYKGTIKILDNNLDNGVVFVLLDACTYDDLNTTYRITFMIQKAEIDEAYKILNSVELITE